MLNQQLADTLDLYSQAHLHTQFVVVLIIWHSVDEMHNGMDDTENAQPLDWRERRRLRAWELHKQCWSQRRIAAELGVTQGAVYQWLKRVREKGSIDALRHHPAPGRHTALTDSQIKEIPACLLVAHKPLDSEAGFWSVVPPAHIYRLLQKYYPDWRGVKKDRSTNK